MDVMNICKTQLLVMAGVTLSSISAVAQNTLPNIILVIADDLWGIERSVFSVIGENSRNALKINWFSCA